MIQRILRQKDASVYLGMCKQVFKDQIRPYVTAIRIGQRGIGFEKVDLDKAFDDYKAAKSVPPTKIRGGICQKNQTIRGLGSVEKSGTLTSNTGASTFQAALKRVS